MTELTVTHHRFPSHATTLATLENVSDEEATLLLSDAGTGAVTIPLGDENDIRVNDLLRFSLDGSVRHAFIAERIEEHALDVGGGGKETRKISGGGAAAVTSWGIIGPANGFGAQPKEQNRLFNVYAPQYDISGWDAAVLTTNPAVPAEWPDQSGALGPYISTTSADIDSTPNGPSLLGTDFTLGADVEATVFCSADNWANVYIDGQPILTVGGNEQTNSYQRTFTARVLLSVGDHRVMVRNYNKGGDNHGGIRFLLATTSTDGTIDDVLLESGTDWSNLETPSPWPGMTPGQAVLIALGEIQDRGRLTFLLTDFDEDEDSSGTPWPVVGDISTKTGESSLYTFLTELSATYVDWIVDPETLTLSLYVKGSYAQVGGDAVPLEPAVVRASDGNLIQLDRIIT